MEKNRSNDNTNRELKNQEKIIRVAGCCEKADLVLKNASYVNVFTGELLTGDIAVANGIIAGIGRYSGEAELDMTGKVVVPGFIDAHIHLESSLLSPAEFLKAVLPHGTTTVVADPHEIANVCGTAGIEYMLQATEDLPVDVRFMLPSCVPAAPVDENGATLGPEDIGPFYRESRVLGLAEMMNFPGVTGCDPAVLGKIADAQAHGKIVDGHAPGLTGSALNAYIAAGIRSDHECSAAAEAMEKLRAGQYIMIREGTAAHNLGALVNLIRPPYASRCMFATDDKHPLDLLEKGHIDYIARKAVRLGADPLLTVCLTSRNAAEYFGLTGKGAVAPGYTADLAVLNDLESFDVGMVFKDGRLVYDGSETRIAAPAVTPALDALVRDTFHLPTITEDRLKASKPLPLIELVPGQIITRDAGHADGIDTGKDVLKAAVAERHHNTGHVGVALVTGYGLKAGAVATSIAHDSHNLIGIGANEEDIALAMNRVAEIGGGIVVTEHGKVTAELRLSIAGLMSDEPLAKVNADLEKAKAQAYRQGVSHGIDPFMTLSFMSLPVIPSLRLLTTGVFSVDKWTPVD